MFELNSVRSPVVGRLLSVLTAVVAVVGVALPAVVGRDNIAILGTYAAIPMLLGVGVHWWTVRREATTIRWGTPHFRAMTGLFFLYVGGCVFLLRLAPVRPLLFYAFVAVAATVVFVEIQTVEMGATRAAAVLAQIVALLLLVVWGISLKYHYYFARTDVFTHAWLTEVLLTDHRVTAEFGAYRSFPLWHLQAATEGVLSGAAVPPRYLLFLTSGVVFTVAVVAVYLLGRRLFDSREIALTAALLTPLNTFVILYASAALPRSITSVVATVMVLAMLADGVASRLLTVLLAVGIAAYHPVTLPFVFVVLVALYAAQRLVPGGMDGPRIDLTDVGIVVAVQFAYWAVFARYMLFHVANILLGAFESGSATGVSNEGIIAFPFREVANYLQFSFVVLCIVYAVLETLSERRVSAPATVAVVAALFLSAISFPGPTLFLEQLSGSFNVFRFGQYTYPFVSVAAAAGLVWLYRADVGGVPSRRTLRLLVVVLFVALSFTAVSNDFVASDNPVVEREFYTYYLTEAEQDGLESGAAVAPGTAMTDHISCKYITDSDTEGTCHILETSPRGGQVFFGNESNLVLVRDDELHRRGAQVYRTERFERDPYYDDMLSYSHHTEPGWERLTRENRVYATDGVVAYGPSGMTDALARESRPAGNATDRPTERGSGRVLLSP